MKTGITGATVTAVVLGASMAVYAQATERPAPPTSSGPLAKEARQSTAPAPAEGSVTLVGCVQREADYRRAHDAGRGGAAGTGAGVGNEFVLVGASTPIAGAPTPDQTTTGASPTEGGTAGTPDMRGPAYELTGPAEGQLEQYVGRRVQIVGEMKSRSTTTSQKRPAVTATVTESTTGRPGPPSTGTASPSGRPSAPARGVDITGRDLHLREFEVVSVREVAGSCTPASK